MPASAPSDTLKVPSGQRQRRPSITLSAPVDEYCLRPRSPNATKTRHTKGREGDHPAEGLRPLERDSRSPSPTSSRQSSRASSPYATAANAILLDSRDSERESQTRKRRSRSNSAQPLDREERQPKRRQAIHTNPPAHMPDRPRSASVQLVSSCTTTALTDCPQSTSAAVAHPGRVQPNHRCLLDRLSPHPQSPEHDDNGGEDTSMAEPEPHASGSTSTPVAAESSEEEGAHEIQSILGSAAERESRPYAPPQPQPHSLARSKSQLSVSHHKSSGVHRLPRARSQSEADLPRSSHEAHDLDRFYRRPGVHQLLDRRGRHIDLGALDPRPLPMDEYLYDFFEDLNPGLGRTEPALRLVHYGFTPSRLEGVTADMWSWYIDFVFGTTCDYSVFILKSTIIEAYLN